MSNTKLSKLLQYLTLSFSDSSISKHFIHDKIQTLHRWSTLTCKEIHYQQSAINSCDNTKCAKFPIHTYIKSDELLHFARKPVEVALRDRHTAEMRHDDLMHLVEWYFRLLVERLVSHRYFILETALKVTLGRSLAVQLDKRDESKEGTKVRKLLSLSDNQQTLLVVRHCTLNILNSPCKQTALKNI